MVTDWSEWLGVSYPVGVGRRAVIQSNSEGPCGGWLFLKCLPHNAWNASSPSAFVFGWTGIIFWLLLKISWHCKKWKQDSLNHFKSLLHRCLHWLQSSNSLHLAQNSPPMLSCLHPATCLPDTLDFFTLSERSRTNMFLPLSDSDTPGHLHR